MFESKSKFILMLRSIINLVLILFVILLLSLGLVLDLSLVLGLYDSFRFSLDFISRAPTCVIVLTSYDTKILVL